MTSSGVCAVVVTRNRRRLLLECLHALLAQSHPLSEIVVFDNASTDGTAELLERSGLIGSAGLRYLRSEVNLGGAGGYAEALRTGSAAGSEWLWLMDDDAEPRPDALERLLGSRPAQEAHTAGLCPAVVHPGGGLDPLHRCTLRRLVTPLPLSAYAPATYAPVDCASFVGLLVRSEAVRAAGLPRREFFLGYDDAEYSLRLRRWGSLRLVPESVITHKHPVGGGRESLRTRWWNRLLGAHYAATPWESYWRDLYRVRNLVALKVAHQGLTRCGLGLVIGAYAVKALLYEGHPLRRIPWLVRFALKGYRGEFSAPSPEQWASFAREGSPELSI
jgi:rhamnopyranosyl-N-acetylglucosaminyl-diphospho-decaprenol beta-1,3/1,4-galactofuranosyltransferase